MTGVETGPHFDVSRALDLDKALSRDRDEVRGMKIEMGTRIGEIIGARAEQLNSLGIFPQQEVVYFSSDLGTTRLTQPLLTLNYREVDPGDSELVYGYKFTGVSMVVTPEGLISNRRIYEKHGHKVVYWTGPEASPEEIYPIGSEALDAIDNINVTALQDPKNHR